MKYSNYIKPYWSRQHGAYITVMVSWLIAVLLSKTFYWIQPVILVFLLSGLNFTELAIEGIGRKTSLPGRKRFWFIVYASIFLLSSALLMIRLKSILFLLPAFVVFGILYIILALRKKQKSVLAEWITFALFSLGGLLAYNPIDDPEAGVFVLVGLLMSSYFGLSIFLVKARLHKISSYAALIYSASVILLLFTFLGMDAFTILLSALFISRAMQTIVWNAWYGRLKIKWIGILEMAYHLVFLLLLIYFSNTVLSYPGKFNYF